MSKEQSATHDESSRDDEFERMTRVAKQTIEQRRRFISADKDDISPETSVEVYLANAFLKYAVSEIASKTDHAILEEVAIVLDGALGDTDLTHLPDEELREQAPVQWASSKVNLLLARVSARSATRTSTDAERLDWLERMHVEVRTPAVHGSFALFHASPVDTDGDEDPSDIRKQIDYQRNGGTKP